jgi:hypothetical protein
MNSIYSSPRRAALDYTLSVAEPKVQLSVSDALTGKEPSYPSAGGFKRHAVQLEAGKSYQIELTTSAFDGHVVLEDSAGRVLVQGLGVEGYNSRLFFRCLKADTYQVVATTRQQNAAGPYFVTVLESLPAPQSPAGGLNR